jgi:hypothetical protein
MEYIAFDAHKHYTLASVARPDGQLVREQRIAHERGALQQFLERCERGSPVAVETVGNWYWIVDEIEAAGCVPRLVHARPRGRRRRTLPHRREAGRLCGHDAARPRQRGEDALRSVPPRRQPLPQVGLR